MLAYVGECWMNLEREISPLHGVKKVKADRELGAETAKYLFAQQLARILMHQGERGQLHRPAAEAKAQTIFFRNAIEAPCEIGRGARQVKVVAHPLAAPWPGIEERHHAKRPAAGHPKPAAIVLSSNHCGGVGEIRIQVVVDALEKTDPVAIRGTPVDKIGALVKLRRRGFGVPCPEIADEVCALAPLNLPTRQIRIHQ